MGKLLLTVLTSWFLVFSASGSKKPSQEWSRTRLMVCLLIGATIQVKGTSIGTATDMDGKYSISAAHGRYPGFQVYRDEDPGDSGR